MRNYEMRKKKRKLSGHSADPREKKWQHGSKVVFDSIVGSFGGGGGGGGGETLRICGESVSVSQCVGFTVVKFKPHFSHKHNIFLLEPN